MDASTVDARLNAHSPVHSTFQVQVHTPSLDLDFGNCARRDMHALRSERPCATLAPTRGWFWMAGPRTLGGYRGSSVASTLGSALLVARHSNESTCANSSLRCDVAVLNTHTRRLEYRLQKRPDSRHHVPREQTDGSRGAFQQRIIAWAHEPRRSSPQLPSTHLANGLSTAIDLRSMPHSQLAIQWAQPLDGR